MSRGTPLTNLGHIKVELLRESHLLLWNEEGQNNRLSHRKTRQHRINAIDQFANFHLFGVFFSKLCMLRKIVFSNGIFWQFGMREKMAVYSVGLFLNESSLFPTEPRRCVWHHKRLLVSLVLDSKRLSQSNQNY